MTWNLPATQAFRDKDPVSAWASNLQKLGVVEVSAHEIAPIQGDPLTYDQVVSALLLGVPVKEEWREFHGR